MNVLRVLGLLAADTLTLLWWADYNVNILNALPLDKEYVIFVAVSKRL